MKENKKNKKRKVRALTEKELKFLATILKNNPVLADADIAHQMKDAKLSSDMCMKDLRNKIRYARLKIVGDKPSERVRVQSLKSGDVVVHKTQTSVSDEYADKFKDETVLKESGLNPEAFALSSYGKSEWEVLKGDEVHTLHSERIKFVRNPSADANACENRFYRDKLLALCGNDASKLDAITPVTSGVYDEIIRNVYANAMNEMDVQKNDNGKYSLVIPLTDLHIGEGNAQKMVKSYKCSFVHAIFPYIHEHYDMKNVRTIEIACLGDLIHCDNDSGTTTAGTSLQPHSDMYKSWNCCVEFFEWLILNIRKEFNIPIRFVYVYGNHDTNAGFGIISNIRTMFRDAKDVEFIVNEKLFGVDEESEDDWFTDSELNPEYLWVKCGNVGITYTHGKFMKKNAKNIPEVANKNARKEVSHNIVIYGHLHHLSEGHTDVGQHNYGLSTPNFVRDKFGKKLGCVTEPEFYLFEINHNTNRASYTPFPSLPYNVYEKKKG